MTRGSGVATLSSTEDLEHSKLKADIRILILYRRQLGSVGVLAGHARRALAGGVAELDHGMVARRIRRDRNREEADAQHLRARCLWVHWSASTVCSVCFNKIAKPPSIDITLAAYLSSYRAGKDPRVE